MLACANSSTKINARHVLICSVLPDASLCHVFRLGPGSVLLRFDCAFRNRPGSAQSLRAWNSSVQSVLIHPAHRDTPTLCNFLYRAIAFTTTPRIMGSRHQEADLLAASNHIIFHFSQKTSRKMEIHQKLSLRNLRTLLPELHLHTSTGKHPCSKWRRYSLNTHPRSQAVHDEISEAQYEEQKAEQLNHSVKLFVKAWSTAPISDFGAKSK